MSSKRANARPDQAAPDDAARPSEGGRFRVGSLAGSVTRALRLLAQGQGLFYFVSGAWPIVAPLSFQIITGPKEDFWLAETVGLLLVVCGAVLFLAGRADRVTREIAFLGAGLAAALFSVDLWCVFEARTTRAYWLDAPVELALLLAWALLWRRQAAR